MGDIGDTWKAVKQARQKKKHERLAKANSDGWKKHSLYHWYRVIDGEKLDYWPSTGLCRYKGRNRNINSKFIKELIK